MRKSIVALCALMFALALVFAGRPAVAAPTFANHELEAVLSGAEEVPDPGDPNGTGAASVTMQSATNICFGLSVSGITLPAAAAHIHEGARGVAGPIVVPLAAPGADGSSGACVDVDAGLQQRILANPAGFYVNVHTSDYPKGAVRGQLTMKGAGTPSTMPDTGMSSTAAASIFGIAMLTLLVGSTLRLIARRRVSAR